MNRIPCAKGTALVDLVRIARQERESYGRFLPADTLAFLETQVLPDSWYPEVHLRELLIATDQIRGRGDLSYCREVLGPRSAEKDLQGGVYQALLKVGDPARTLQSLPTLWSLYHDSGVVSVDVEGTGTTMFLEGFGLPSAALCATTEGWMLEAVRLAGGVAPAVVHDACVSRGAGSCRFRVGWNRGS